MFVGRERLESERLHSRRADGYTEWAVGQPRRKMIKKELRSVTLSFAPFEFWVVHVDSLTLIGITGLG